LYVGDNSNIGKEINLKEQMAGMYLVKIQTIKGVVSVKVVKK
jgi:hypothetical protein